MLKKYFKDIFDTAKAGDVREESYYPALKQLFENWVETSGKKYYITALPKKTDGGNPDFRILTIKKDLARIIVTELHNTEDAQKAQENFEKTVQQR